MIIFPAIDIQGGNVVRLRQGKKNEVDVFSSDPLEMALHWENAGVKWLHLVDLDGAFNGSSVNLDLITRIASTVRIPIQVGGGIRDIETAAQYLDAGVTRLIIGTVALEDHQLYENMLNKFPGKIGLSIDASNGRLKTRGWVEDSGQTINDVLPAINSSAFLIYTDIERDGMRSGINLQALRNLLTLTPVPVIAAGGVSCLDDVKDVYSLRSFGHLEGVIAGRAIYEGSLDPGQAQTWLDRQTG